MIKHDKSILDVKSTIKGSRRIEDKILRTKSLTNKLPDERMNLKAEENGDDMARWQDRLVLFDVLCISLFGEEFDYYIYYFLSFTRGACLKNIKRYVRDYTR